MKMDKKAVMEDFLQLVAWSIVMIIVFFIFVGIKTTKITELIDNSEKIKTEIDVDYLLIDFFKQKTENPNAENMAELIGLYYETRDDKVFDEVKQKTQGFFSKSFLEASKSSWAFRIYDKEKNEIKKIDGSLPNLAEITGSEKTVSSIIIPVNNDDYMMLEISSIKMGESEEDND